MQTWTKKLKPIIWVVLICFTYTAVGGNNFVYAATEERSQKSEVKSQKKEKTTAEKWTEAIDELVKSEEIRVEELRVKEEELKELDKELRREFKETEEFLKDKKLPDKILQRHYDFVKQYEENFANLQSRLSVAISANNTEQKTKIKELQEFIEKAQYRPKPKPLDPNKLPHRMAPKLTPKPPRIKVDSGQKSVDRYQKAEGRGQNERLKPELQSAVRNPHPTSHISHPLYASAGFPDTFVLAQAIEEQSPISNLPTEADLSETIDVQITPEIRQLATNTLKSNPVLIYEYVRNNFDYEPYYGSLKGSQETLWEKAGNDFDLASLLIALYRAANIPARYVYGTIEIPIEQAMNWVGVKDKKTCGDMFASGGIPSALGISGGEISKLKIEHVWVEIYIPYLPDEGVSISRGNKMWVSLDPSFKQYTTKEDIDLSLQLQFDTNAYLSGTKTISPVLEYFNQLVDYLNANMPDKKLVDILRLKGIIKEEFGILPDSLAYDTLAVLDKYSEIPGELRHKISFKVGGIDYTVRFPELAGKRITLSYIPAASDDEKIAKEYGGLYYAPAYLTNLKPVLRVEGETKIVGLEVKMGTTQNFTIQFVSPEGLIDITTKEITGGSYYAIGLNMQNIPSQLIDQRIDKFLDAKDLFGILNIKNEKRDDFVGEILYDTLLFYFQKLDKSYTLLEQLMHVVKTKGISEGTMAFELNTTYLFQIPKSIEISKLSMDIDRIIVTPFVDDGNFSKQLQFMRISGMEASYWEHALLEECYGLSSISAVKLLRIANQRGITIHNFNSNNAGEIIPQLGVSDTVKEELWNYVNAGRTITIPQTNISVNNWNGVGYIAMDLETGAGGYIISGELAGGTNDTYIPGYMVHYLTGTTPKDFKVDMSRAWAILCLGKPERGFGGWIKRICGWGIEHIYDVADGLYARGYNVVYGETFTKNDFNTLLAQNRTHKDVFYFMGHGGGVTGNLILDPKDGEQDISPDDVSGDFKIVFLSGCHTFKKGREFAKVLGINESEEGKEIFIGYKGIIIGKSWINALNFWELMISSFTAGESMEVLLTNREHIGDINTVLDPSIP
ncbi:MAG: transglutaminase domain-containing protein [bacterium]